MRRTRASLSLAGRLTTACLNGDLPSAKAAIADGASVNEEGKAPGWHSARLPLAAAVTMRHNDVVVWLLSHGADPNGDHVTGHGALGSTTAILQLLIDAGGDVNRNTGDRPPLFWVIGENDSGDHFSLLLAQPSLDFTVTYDGKTPQQFAHDCIWVRIVLMDMIVQEVSRSSFPFEDDCLCLC